MIFVDCPSCGGVGKCDYHGDDGYSCCHDCEGSGKTVPKTVYANAVNINGLYSPEPVECQLPEDVRFYDDPFLDEQPYWTNSHLRVTSLGEEEKWVVEDHMTHYTIFAAPNKAEVEIWTRGVMAAMRVVRNWSSGHIEQESM